MNELPPSHEKWPRVSWDRHREQVRRSNRARTRTVNWLIEKYRDDFEWYYAEQAALEDPPVTPRSRRQDDAAELEAEIARLQNQLRRIESEGGDE